MCFFATHAETYGKALEVLGDSVILNNRVIKTDPSGSKPTITVQTPVGVQIIYAKKLLIPMLLVPKNLEAIDFSVTQMKYSSRFKANAYYIGNMRETGLWDDIGIDNFGENRRYNPSFWAYACKPAYIDGMAEIRYGTEE